MSDYARAGSGGATHFGDKDALTTGDANKVIVGGQFDDEFNAILTACNSKYDSADLASQAAAEAGTNNVTLMTPLRAEQHMTVWAAENDAMITDIHALNLAADALLGWDQSGTAVIGFTMASGSGLSFATTTLDWGASGLSEHDNFADFVSDEHVAHAGVTITAGTGLTGGGTIAATRTLNVIGGDGITANANDIALTAQAVSTTVPISIASGLLGWDSSSITEMDIEGVSQSADGFLVDDAGVLKVLPYDFSGIKVASVSGTTDTIAASDMNVLTEYTSGSAITITLNDSVGRKGNILVFKQTGAGQITVSGSAALQSSNGLKTRAQHSIITLVCLVEGASAEWALYGDSSA